MIRMLHIEADSGTFTTVERRELADHIPKMEEEYGKEELNF